MLAKSLKTTGLAGCGARLVPPVAGVGFAGVDGVGWVGMVPLLLLLLAFVSLPQRVMWCPRSALFWTVTRLGRAIMVKTGRKCGRNKAAA